MKTTLGHPIQCNIFIGKGTGSIGQVSLVKHVRRKSRKNNMKLSNGPEPGFYDKSKSPSSGALGYNF